MITPVVLLSIDEKNVDVKKVEQYLKTIDCTFQDPHNSKVFFLCGNKKAFDYQKKELSKLYKKLGPNNYPYSGTLIMLFRYPDCIEIAFGAGNNNKIIEFIKWIDGAFHIKEFTGSEGEDLTKWVREKGVGILFK